MNVNVYIGGVVISTIKDVAKKAGVSIATVSRVINKLGYVSDETEKKVFEAVKELNYQPNLLGRNLRFGNTKKILVLIPSISHQFYSKVVSAIENRVTKDGYTVMVCMTHMDPKIEHNCVEMLRSKFVDGIIFFAANMTSSQMTALADKFPAVQCAEYLQGSHTSTVSIDAEKASYDATKHLIDRGHSKIAFFSSKEEYTSALQKESGYIKALSAAGIKAPRKYIFYDSYSYDSGKRLVNILLGEKDRPTAIFAISDSVAIGAIKELHEKGFYVPEDISVMGFDDTSISKRFIPAITTISQPQKEMGFTAAKLLIKKIQNIKEADENIILPHKLIIRDTVKNLL